MVKAMAVWLVQMLVDLKDPMLVNLMAALTES